MLTSLDNPTKPSEAATVPATESRSDDLSLLHQLNEVYDQKQIAEMLGTITPGHWTRETINRALKGKAAPRFSHREFTFLENVLPTRPEHYDDPKFRFIDLFAGIGGLRQAFESVEGKCVFTSEWDESARRTYKANFYCDPNHRDHIFNHDIRDVTLSAVPGVDEEAAYRFIDDQIPDHEVLLAGFPCQPFSLAGVSKKNSLGRVHGFECDTQGTLFFDVARIIAAKKPPVFLLENVKNLKSHDKGKTFRVICEALDELGYEVADVDAPKGDDPKVIDARNFLPQHRERIALVGFRRDLGLHEDFSLRSISGYFPEYRPRFGDLLDEDVDDKYILTPKLWQYLYDYAAKHRAKGNGFGFSLTGPNDTARTLSARYHKDGSEILVDRGFDPNRPFDSDHNLQHRPRRLTPRECARLMGFDGPGESQFRIPVSDTQAYRQFGNSVAVPVFTALAQMLKDRIPSPSASAAETPRQLHIPLAV